MEITASSKSIKCLIRKKWVANTPEERVRQRFLWRMIHLGYPKGLIAVEKSLGERRFDIVCFNPSIKPILLVECKAEKITPESERQAIGYNGKLKAPFISLAGGEEIKTFWMEEESLKSVPFLPPYKELYAAAEKL